MSPIFRQNPPLDIVLKVLLTFGLSSLYDASWFAKSHVRLDKLEEVLIELEPYYIPCKAKEYLYTSLTQIKAVTILRQILKVYDIHLQTSERGRGNVKTVWYHLDNKSLSKDIPDGHIEFN